MEKTKKKLKVLVCLSGGVDSSVAAALLLQQGYDVTGAYMKQWTDTKDIHGICSWKDDRREALRVAAHLSIPFLTLDFEKEYKEWVVKYMFQEYEAGRTPNPDVMCNLYIKFGVWLEKAKEMGFEYLATGRLMEAKDEDKDQTYFLHQLNQEKLSRTLFPVGGYTKKQVRALAKKMKLPTAERTESMGICFIGEIPMKDFLQQKIKPKKGDIVDLNGHWIGEHEGLPFYTIGQRHGLSQAGGGKPYFVVEKEQKKNQLVVGFEDSPLLYRQKVEVQEVNWINGQNPGFPLQCQVRLRHRQPMQKATLYREKNGKNDRTIFVEFQKSQKAVTPGQFAVFYKNGECLGGGVIF